MTAPDAQPADFAPHLTLVGDSATWTEDQWREHDERVRGDIARRESTDLAEQLRQKRQAYLDAGFPLRALVAAESADDSQPTLARVARWRPSEHNVLVIAGPAGCGKTVAAAWWALRRATPPMFLRASTFAASSRYHRDDRNAVLAASALVLDDLGAEYLDDKGSFLVDLDEVMDTFYGAMRPLLITTNLDAAKFQQRYGERLNDRIRECGAFFSASAKSMRKARAR